MNEQPALPPVTKVRRKVVTACAVQAWRSQRRWRLVGASFTPASEGCVVAGKCKSARARRHDMWLIGVRQSAARRSRRRAMIGAPGRSRLKHV